MSTLPVIFRAEKDGGEVTAVFPTVPGTSELGTFTVYARVGQHGVGNKMWYRTTRAAKEAEYASLLEELKSIYETRRSDPERTRPGDEPVVLRVVRSFSAHYDVQRSGELRRRNKE